MKPSFNGGLPDALLLSAILPMTNCCCCCQECAVVKAGVSLQKPQIISTRSAKVNESTPRYVDLGPRVPIEAAPLSLQVDPIVPRGGLETGPVSSLAPESVPRGSSMVDIPLPERITRSETLVLPPFSDAGMRPRAIMAETPTLFSNNTKAFQRENADVSSETPVLPSLTQFTPTYAPGGVTGASCVDYQTSVTNSYPGLRHDPDGIYWIDPSSWVTAQWDGVTTWDPSTLTAAQVSAGIFPTVNTMRGLRELFYEVNPFADVQNPTVAEIDNWNIRVLQHFRRLLGRAESHPVVNDTKLYLEAHWASERYKTTIWDERYPVDESKPSTWGPCTGSTNAHCGAAFVPSCQDQVPYYLDPNQACFSKTASAEGIFSVNTNLPWSIKFARTIAITLLTDGLGGHTAPFLGRGKVGLSWMCGPTTSSLRVKWND